MGGSSGGNDPVKYYATEEQVICLAPADSIVSIKINDEQAYDGVISQNSIIHIDKPDLFGGKDSEGGVSGYCEVRFGDQNQPKSSYLAEKVSDVLSATRGVLSIVIKDFYLGQNPYAKPWHFRVKSTLKNYDYTSIWYAEKSSIHHGNDMEELEILEKISFNGEYPHLSATKDGVIVGFFTPKNFSSVRLAYKESMPIYRYTSGLTQDSVFYNLQNRLTSLMPVRQYGTQHVLTPVENTAIVFNVNKYVQDSWVSDKSGSFMFVNGYCNAYTATNGEPLGKEFSVGSFYSKGSSTAISKLEFKIIIELGTVSVKMADSGMYANNLTSVVAPTITIDGDTRNKSVYMDTGGNAFVLNDNTHVMTAYVPNHEASIYSEKFYKEESYELSSFVHDGDTVLCFYADKSCNSVYVFVKDLNGNYFLRNGSFGYSGGEISITPIATGDITKANCYFVNGAEYLYLFIADSAFKFTKVSLHTSEPQIDYNPIHAIREAITSKYWGLGKDESFINDENFKACADILFKENVGISFAFESDDKVSEFIQDVLEIINGTIRVNRTSGKLEVKLARNDYDKDNLLVFDKTNIIEISDISRTALSECINQVTVKYTNCETGGDASVVYQDLALLQQVGEVNNADLDVPYIHWSQTANIYAKRKIEELSTAYLSCQIKTTSIARNLNLYDVVIVNVPELKIYNVVFRIIKMDVGSSSDTEITLTLSQDKFDMPVTTSISTPEDKKPTETPKNNITQYKVLETPYYFLYKRFGVEVVNGELNKDPHYAKICTLYTLYNSSLVTSVQSWIRNKDSPFYNISDTTSNFLSSCVVRTAISKTDTYFNFSVPREINKVQTGTLCICGSEIMVIGTIDAVNNSMSIGRGCFDTHPQEHIAGDCVFFIQANTVSIDQGVFSLESIDVKLLPISDGKITLNDIDPSSVMMLSRANSPYPITNVKINNSYFPANISVDNYSDPFNIKFNTRNRLLQLSDVVSDWYSSANNQLEENSVIMLSFFTSNGKEIKEYAITNNANVTIPYDIEDKVMINIDVVRDGLYYNFQPFALTMNIVGDLGFDIVYNNGEISLVMPKGYPIELHYENAVLSYTADSEFNTKFAKQNDYLIRTVEV